MTKKTRTLLFSILLFCFLVIAPATVFYSWGYRFNFETKKITKTGAFYFKIWPKSAQIYLTPLDNKGSAVREKNLIKKTDFFFGAALIENLLPKRYEIEIKKDGFCSWKKILEIKENEVTEAKNIVLVPEDLGINLLAKNVENFFFSPDEKIIILKEVNETYGTSSTTSAPEINYSNWALKVFELEKNVKSPLIDSRDISKDATVKLLDLKFSPDSKRILLEVNYSEQDAQYIGRRTTSYKGSLKYFLFDLNVTPSKAVPLDFLNTDTEQVFFHPQNPQKLFIFEKGSIFEADLSQNKISSKLLQDVKSFQISNGDFYYLDNYGFLFKNDSSFSKQEKINNLPFSLEKDKNYQINILSDSIFLADDQKLYFFNSNLGSFEKFFEMEKKLKISPDFKKIVYSSDYEIWILFLKPELGQPRKEAGERVFIARFSEKIGEVFFLNSHYLIFNSGEKIKAAEIDDRDIINIIDLAEFKSPKIFWDQIFKKLFILTNGNFYNSGIFVP